MPESSVIGKVVGVPECPDPHHTGLCFSIDTGSRRHDFQVAGNSPLEQSHLSALAMTVALAAAARRGFDVEVTYNEDFPHVALGVVLPHPNPNRPAQGSDTLANPYQATINTMAVLDYGGGPGVEIELSWAGASGNAYFGSNDEERVLEWATLLASAVMSGAAVTVEWSQAMRGADREIVSLTIG